jgi:hypothetical protein
MERYQLRWTRGSARQQQIPEGNDRKKSKSLRDWKKSKGLEDSLRAADWSW